MVGPGIGSLDHEAAGGVGVPPGRDVDRAGVAHEVRILGTDAGTTRSTDHDLEPLLDSCGDGHVREYRARAPTTPRIGPSA